MGGTSVGEVSVGGTSVGGTSVGTIAVLVGGMGVLVIVKVAMGGDVRVLVAVKVRVKVGTGVRVRVGSGGTGVKVDNGVKLDFGGAYGRKICCPTISLVLFRQLTDINSSTDVRTDRLSQ